MVYNNLSPYQKSSRAFFQIMSLVVLILCSYFIFKMNLEGANLSRTPFFWFIVIISVIAMIGLIFAGRWASNFGKDHPYPEMKKWDFLGLPALLGFSLSYILPQVSDGKWGIIVSVLLISASSIYMGIVSIKNKLFLLFGFFKTSPEVAVLLGKLMIVFGILFLLVLFLII